NSSLGGNTRRAIDIREGEKINEVAWKNLIRETVALKIRLKNKGKPKTKTKPPRPNAERIFSRASRDRRPRRTLRHLCQRLYHAPNKFAHRNCRSGSTSRGSCRKGRA